MYWVPLMLGVTMVLGLGIVGITRFPIISMVLTIDWGSGCGPKVSTKYHDPLVINGMVGIGLEEDIGSTGATGINNGPNRFVIGGL